MTVVAAYLYRHGARVRPVSIDEKIDCPQDKSEFVWIGVADPTDEELHALQNSYDLHPLAVEDARIAGDIEAIIVASVGAGKAARLASMLSRCADDLGPDR